MTKQQELAWLDKAINELGPHTYLGASLADQRNLIANNILNDFPAFELNAIYQQQFAASDELKAVRKLIDEENSRLRETRFQQQSLDREVSTLELRRTSIITVLQREARRCLSELKDLCTV